VFVGLLFVLLSPFVDISYFFWVGREKTTTTRWQKTEGKIVDRSSKG